MTTPKERPVLFSGPMIRAILDGKKTMTRRLLREQPIDIIACPNPKRPDGKTWITLETRNPNHGRIIGCRFGVAGDRLWVRESAYIALPNFGHDRDANLKDNEGRPRVVGWAASMDADSVRCATDFGVKKTPSIHMPRWASRITLEVVSVRVERLQAITFEDVMAEGLDPLADCPGVERPTTEARTLFGDLWDAINAKRGCGWESNPFVWVVSFRRCDA